MANLWVVVPVFNEQETIESVTLEWISKLRLIEPDFKLCLIDDGSHDTTASILERLALRHREINVFHKTNSGHGQSCIEGYRRAIKNNASWVFQIDSDGQCDPSFFEQFWKAKEQHPLCFGYRKYRDDGIGRRIISRVLTLVIFVASGQWVRDSNVPYRLMRSDLLSQVLPDISPDVDLANAILSVRLQQRYPLKWIDIRFLRRRGGHAKTAIGFFATKAQRFWKDLHSQ